MASSSTASNTPEVNIAYLFGRLWAARFGVLLFVAVITGLVYLFTQVAEPRYAAEAQLLIEAQETGFTRPDAEEGRGDIVLDERDVASEVQVLVSRDVAIQVIDRLNLGELEEFDPARGGTSLVDSILILLGLAEDPLSLSADERVFRNYDGNLTVYNIPGSRVVVVGFESSDPDLSARVANTVVDVYQEAQQAAQATTTRSATSFLEIEINELRDEVAAAEAAVARFRTNSGLLLGPNNTTLSSQQLSELSSELTRARTEQSNARSRAQEVRSLIASQGTQLALPDDFSTPLTQRLQEEQAQIRASIAELSATLLPGHPRIQELGAQQRDLGNQLRDEAGRVAQRFDNAAQVAEGRAQALEDQLAQLSAEAARTAEAEVELRALEREAAAQRDLLSSYLVRFREAATRDEPALLPTNARVIQTAQVDREAVFPRTLPMIIVGFVGSLAFSLLGVTSHAILSTAAREDEPSAAEPIARDYERMEPVPAPVAAAAPSPVSRPQIAPAYAAPDRHRPYEDHSPDVFDPAYAGATTLQPARRVDPPPAPVSPLPQVPPAPMPQTYALADPTDCRRLFAHFRTLGLGSEDGLRITVGAADMSITAGDLALRLARATALSGRSVVMIDAVGDLRALGLIADGPGFYELVTGQVTFDVALHKDPKSTLHIVPGGYSLARPDMVADDAADLVISAFATSYDAVIVNAGRDPQLLLECARINGCMVLGGQANRVAALAQTLSPIVRGDRVVAVQMPQAAVSPTASPVPA
ncbi:MAG: hypothetical protein KI785_15540 [Devosiaceae bacterium]|nr:hypothetical protein [Devosiaceae bacterium MH13]